MITRSEAISSSIAASIDNAPEEWKRWYVRLAKILLERQMYICGDDIKAFCILRHLWEPDTHNRWVGMPVVLERNGWIEPLVYVKPHRNHNHMPLVTYYRSLLFDERTLMRGVIHEVPCG